jgi:hypothetical protein
MPVTNPWLAGPTRTGQLSRERLEERILNLLSSQNMCVLATTGPSGPLATPIRYYPLDFAIMFTAAPRSPKLRNIAADPRVSVGIFAPLVSLASSRGAQLFGTARVLDPDHPDHIQTEPTTGQPSDGRTSTPSAANRCRNRPATPSWSSRPTASSTPSTGYAARASPHDSSGAVDHTDSY